MPATPIMNLLIQSYLYYNNQETDSIQVPGFLRLSTSISMYLFHFIQKYV